MTTRARTLSTTQHRLNLVGGLTMLTGALMRTSTLSHALRIAGMSCIWIAFLLAIRSGYLRRRLYWTSESWRRFLLACSIPVAALVLLFGISAAPGDNPVFIGAPRSVVRLIWVTVGLLSMLFGAIGLAVVTSWLNEGDASQQFSWRRR